jgi:hypothetical protein
MNTNKGDNMLQVGDKVKLYSAWCNSPQEVQAIYTVVEWNGDRGLIMWDDDKSCFPARELVRSNMIYKVKRN